MDAEEKKTDAGDKEGAKTAHKTGHNTAHKASPKPEHNATPKADAKAVHKSGHKPEAKSVAKPKKPLMLKDSRILIAACLLCIAAIVVILLIWPVEDVPHGAAPGGASLSDALGNYSGGAVVNATGSAAKLNASDFASGFSISFTADKREYYSKQTMNLTARVVSPIKTDDVEVWFFGIKNKYGANKVMLKVKPDLAQGENTVTAQAVLPSCYGCSGIAPGNYTMYAGVYAKDNTQFANATSWVMMMK